MKPLIQMSADLIFDWCSARNRDSNIAMLIVPCWLEPMIYVRGQGGVVVWMKF